MRFDQIVMYLVFILWGTSSSFQNNGILVIEKMDHSSLASLIGSDSSMSMQSTEYMNSKLQMVTMWIIAMNYIGIKDTTGVFI